MAFPIFPVVVSPEQSGRILRVAKKHENMKLGTLNRHKTGQIWSSRGVSTTSRKLAARSIFLEGSQSLFFLISSGKKSMFRYVLRETNEKHGTCNFEPT